MKKRQRSDGDDKLSSNEKGSSTSDSVSKLQSYKAVTKKAGEDLVKNVFPGRVFEMDKLLNSDQFSPERNVVEEIHLPLLPSTNGQQKAEVEVEEDGSPEVKRARKGTPLTTGDHVVPVNGCPVLVFPGGAVKINATIKEMTEVVKPKITRLMDEAQLVRLWIQFNVPRIEDGNNFGVQIQEEALSEASQIERDACTFLDQISRYYASRGRLVAKVAKYPHIEDFREGIRDMDDKEAITLRYMLMEIRNHYATLHDMIDKNLDRIKTPRSNNSISMY